MDHAYLTSVSFNGPLMVPAFSQGVAFYNLMPLSFVRRKEDKVALVTCWKDLESC